MNVWRPNFRHGTATQGLVKTHRAHGIAHQHAIGAHLRTLRHQQKRNCRCAHGVVQNAKLLSPTGWLPSSSLPATSSLLQRTHDVLPFLEQQVPSKDAVFRRLPDEMVDLLATSPDFQPPLSGTGPVWLQLESENGSAAVVIVARPKADGELWVVAPDPVQT